MCTNITLESADHKFLMARTMDFSFNLDPMMAIFPRRSRLRFDLASPIENHFAFMGLTKDVGNYYIADGINEFGLTGAALYFEGYAYYQDKSDNFDIQVAPHEVVMWMLAQCKTIEEVKIEFGRITVVNEIMGFLGIVPPLHWVFLDRNGNSIIVEIMKDGIHIDDNSLGVLTNSPDYNWHMTNIRNYIGLDPHQLKTRIIYGIEFKPFGQGSGTFGLPGDLTPPSRFIKTLYNKISSHIPENAYEMLLSATHILNGVDIPKGSVITQRDTIDYTQYTSYMVNNDNSYYYRMYDSLHVFGVSLNDFNIDTSEIIIFQ